jgi:hypothetical protein
MLPDCGCDACDSGSDDLLSAIDEVIGHVVAGPFVVLRGHRWDAQWSPDGGRSAGAGSGPDHTRMMDCVAAWQAAKTSAYPRMPSRSLGTPGSLDHGNAPQPLTKARQTRALRGNVPARDRRQVRADASLA